MYGITNIHWHACTVHTQDIHTQTDFPYKYMPVQIHITTLIYTRTYQTWQVVNSKGTVHSGGMRLEILHTLVDIELPVFASVSLLLSSYSRFDYTTLQW